MPEPIGIVKIMNGALPASPSLTKVFSIIIITFVPATVVGMPVELPCA